MDKSGYVYVGAAIEHRLVMERLIGRKLRPGESVHHINGIRSDNRPINLELWSSGQPAGQRVSQKLRFFYQLAVQYVPELRGLLEDHPKIKRKLENWSPDRGAS